MITISSLNKHFGSLHVLKNINLEIREREIMAIVGPSGAGKTTLLQIAGTLDTPDSGSILYDTISPLKMKDRELSAFRNKNIGFVFQFHRLIPEFTALYNVALPAMIGGMNASAAKKRASELLDLLGIGERRNHRPAQLSGGECQRVAIARALVNSPMVVFADEPTGSLDSVNREEIKNLISHLRNELGQTFVIVTHDSSLADVADRKIVMDDGMIM